MLEMRSIERLPEAVRSSMRSGVLMFDLTRVVEELVFNSLDAGATKVSVALGVETCCVKVADNGYGITRDGLVLLGERYATSKFELMGGTDALNESFGFRGEALGSISDVSLLEIVTKAHGMPNGYRKVIKGCKCLYLGIDDDRQDVGTTVIVRDLFYNQPVRRKHLQSSPKKVLHSVKETVLRIALVHLKVSFRLIDMESGEELLCTPPSSSPLALLMSGFGVEVSSSLHELDVSDRFLRLSGYASVPSLTFPVKAVQYFYINSRFISKGQIHKLLNQLAARFSYLDATNDNIECQKGKQSRCQMCATYILNLKCPRAHYDLTFEPSKTTVEFKIGISNAHTSIGKCRNVYIIKGIVDVITSGKRPVLDWDPVLGFIEETVSHLWSQKISLVREDSLIHAADKSPKEVMWEEGAHTLPTIEDLPAKRGISKKRSMGQSAQDSRGFLSPQPARVSKESGNMSTWTNSRFSCGNSPEDSFQWEDQQTGTGFAFQTDVSFQSCDESLDQCRVTVLQESDSHVGTPGRYISSAEDHYYQYEFAREGPNECVDLSAFRRECMAPKFDSNKSSVRSGGYFKIANDVKVDVDHKKPSLRSCSTQVSLVPDGSCFANFEETGFQADGFRRKKRLRTLDWDDIEDVNDEHDIVPGMITSISNGLSGDCFGISDDLEMGDEYFEKPSIRSWSSPGSLHPDGACFTNFEGWGSQADGFRKKKRATADNWNDIGEINYSEHGIGPKVDSTRSNGLSSHHLEIAYDVQKVDEDLKKPSLRSCSSRANALADGACFANFEDSGYRKKKKQVNVGNWNDNGEVNNIEQGTATVAAAVWSSPSVSTTYDRRIGLVSGDPFTMKGKSFPEGNTCQPDPVSPVRITGHRSRTVDSEWYSLSRDPEFVGKVPDVKHFRDEDVSGWHRNHNKTAGSKCMADTEGIDDILSLARMEIPSVKVPCPLSGFINSPLARTACTRGRVDIKEFQGDCILFPENSDNFDEREWLNFGSFDKSDKCKYAVASSHKPSLSYLDKERTRTRTRTSLLEKMHGCQLRSRRSCSAPPFCKSKKKFFALSNMPTIETGKSRFKTIHDASTLQEARDLKHMKKSSSIDHLSLNVIEDYQSNARQDIKTSANIAEPQNSEMEYQCSDIYNTASIEDFASKETEGALDSGSKWRDSCPSTTGGLIGNFSKGQNGAKPDVFTSQDNILNISSGILHLSGDSLVPKSISKKLLENARVLQQVDRKFIPIVAAGTLAIIDQHAADERIRLEELRGKVLSGEMKTITHLEAEKELALPEIGYQLLHNYAEQIQKWGWICNFHSQTSKSFKRNLNILHRQPSVTTLLAVPCILGVNLTDVDLLEFLQQLADTDGSSTIPQAVLRVLNFKACRGAIMFGDKLLPSECSLVVEELKKTSLCFQCAHGRPTTVPLVDLNALHKQITKLQMSSNGSVESWHGLRRHKPSLQRASQRLNPD